MSERPGAEASPTTARPAAGDRRSPRSRFRSTRYHVLHALRRTLVAARERHLGTGEAVVDLGCGSMPYRPVFADAAGTSYTGVDVPDNPEADVHLAADGSAPLPSECADLVLSTQVLEHVPDPEAHLHEARRLLRGDGLLFLTTHGIWRYHPDPEDLWRWTSEGLRRRVARSGFTVLEVIGVVGLGATGLQLFQDWLEPRLPGFLRPAVVGALQTAMELVDRLTSDLERSQDACVFLVVARKSEEEDPGLHD